MVGVPGRSKGCNTCRKRKVGCSLERPECSQCLRSGRKCLGYDRETIFLHNNTQYTTQELVKKDKSEPPNHEPNLNDPIDVSGSQDYFSIPDVEFNSPDSLALVSLCNTAVRQQVLASYFHQAAITTTSIGGETPWLSIIPNMTNIDKPLEYAALALAIARIGREYYDNQYVNESLQLYVQGLRHMQLALWDPKRMHSDEVLGACMLLTVYEVVECPSQAGSGYLSHQNGCARLIQLRGPKAHVNGLGHSLFIHFRYMAALQSLATKSTFISEPEWMTIPFSSRPKRVLDLFLDILLQGLPLLRDGENLGNLPPHMQFAKAVDLLKRCWKLDNQLRSFYEDFKASTTTWLFWPVFSADNDNGDGHADSLAHLSLEFSDMKTAVLIMLYWATLTILWSAMAHLYDNIDEFAALLNPTSTMLNDDLAKSEIYQKLDLPEPGHCRDIIVVARKVFQCVDYCMRDEMGRRVVVAPLMMTIDSLNSWKDYGNEVAWALDKLKQVQQTGTKLVKYIINPRTRWWK